MIKPVFNINLRLKITIMESSDVFKEYNSQYDRLTKNQYK